jgi:sialic acid synthase SpsE
MLIGQRTVGPEQPPYIIAEIGVNHDGSPERALDLARAAADAGANAVKLQLFETDRLMSNAAKLAAYQRAAGETDPVAMLRRLELTLDAMAPVVSLAHARGLHAIVTVFSVELVAAADRLPWDAYKVASPDLIHRPLLEALAATGKPMIVSTGASVLEEVGRAAGWLAHVRSRLAFMQCVSAYPTPITRAEFGGIGAIAEAFQGPVGYSDHTEGTFGAYAAVINGAVLLEKHLTYDRGARGPDHAASLEPDALAEYVQIAVKAYQLPKGDTRSWEPFRLKAMQLGENIEIAGVKRVTPIEQDVRAVSRQSIVLTRAMKAGEVPRNRDVTFKRPGSGLPPHRIDEVIRLPLARDVEADVPLVEEDVAWPSE